MLVVGITDEDDRLIDMMQFGFLVGLFFEQIAMRNFDPLPSDTLGQFCVRGRIRTSPCSVPTFP